jgi:hypothetical protein
MIVMVTEQMSVRVARVMEKSGIPPKTRDVASGTGILIRLREVLPRNRWKNSPATPSEVEKVKDLFRNHPLLRPDFAEVVGDPTLLGEIRAILHEPSGVVTS